MIVVLIVQWFYALVSRCTEGAKDQYFGSCDMNNIGDLYTNLNLRLLITI